MINALFLTVAAACFAAAVHKAPGLRAGATPATRALCVFLTALGLAFTTLSPAVQHLEDRLVPNIGRLLSNSFTLIAACATLVMLLHLTYTPESTRPKARLRVVGLMVAIAVMATMFVAAPLQPSQPGEASGTFGDLYDTELTLVIYVLAYSGYLGAALVDLLRLGLRYASYTTQTALSAGLRVVAVGCVLGLAYLGEKVAYVVSQWSGLPLFTGGEQTCSTPFTPTSCFFAVGLPAVAVLTIIVGATLPVWGPKAAAPVRVARAWRSYRRLYPLWAALHAAVPEEMLTSPSGLGSKVPGDIHFRRYRRVIEIRDGCLALRFLRDPSAAETAESAGRETGLRGDEHHATVEAAVLADAIAARQAGHDPEIQPDHGTDPQPLPGPDSPDLAAEIDWLEKVAEAFARSPIVEQARHAPRQARHGDPT